MLARLCIQSKYKRIVKLHIVNLSKNTNKESEQTYKPFRRLLFKTDFAPIYKLSENNKNIMKESIKRLRIICSVPTIAYTTLLITHFPLTLLSISGILFTELISYKVYLLMLKKYRNIVDTIEITKNVEDMQISVLEPDYRIKKISSPLFNVQNKFTNCFKSSEIKKVYPINNEPINKSDKNKKHINKLVIDLNKDGVEESVFLNLEANELSGYNDYLEAMVKNKRIKF